jgi:superoxide dismutase, Cu-Zn family
MKKIIISTLVIFAIFMGCKSINSSQPENKLTVVLEPKSKSSVIGTATFIEKNGKVNFEAKIAGLSSGIHAIHIHEKADCTSADGSSAGGHWNPTFKKHGKWEVEEFHKGDIGNFTADANGNASITLTTDQWCIGCDDETKNILGKGLIVHAGTDDFTSQPAGNAGARQACAGIIK